MNCQRCGAPLEWDGSRPIIVCDYCRSIQSVDRGDGAGDRVVPLDHPVNSNCPRCGQQLTAAAMDGVKVEHCRDCRGVLVESELFAMLVKNRRAGFRGTESLPVPLDLEQLKIEVDCPHCRRPMEVHPYYGPGNIVIDSCRACRLVWLDCREMSAIELAPGSR